ncbi:MAG: glycosyltransferase family 39 protein [Anaerolineales bacterium]|nr:glycosyltransferase family 39 protein [Anaerolineales bacterium]
MTEPKKNYSFNLKEYAERAMAHPHTPAIILYLINLFLLTPVFFPSLVELGVWDQPAYIASGQQLIDHGIIPAFAGNPLTSFLYGLTYLPFRSSPLWMVHSCSLGRVLLFTLLWLGLYLIGRELSNKLPALLLPGFLLVTPLAAEMMTFPSDPLFAGFAALSFWQLLRFEHSRSLRSLALASLFLGLAALSRNDGLVLFPILIVLALLINRREGNWLKTLGATALPYVILVGGYVLLYGFATGNFDLGTAARTYENFESGHQFLLDASGDVNRVVESRIQSRAVFGTPEENNYNVFTAILRNPTVYFQRIKLLLTQLPAILLGAYGKRFAPLVFLLALKGIWILVQRREWFRLALFLLWPAHLLTGFIITLIRPGHLTFVYFIVYALAGIGLAALIEYPVRWKPRIVCALALIILALYGLLDAKLAFYYAAAVLLLSLVAITVVQKRNKAASPVIALLILAGAGVILRQGFPSPRLRALGSSEPEQAVIFMNENLPEESLVAAGSPGFIQAARMQYFGLASTDIPYNRPPDQFMDWMQSQGVQFIFADYSLIAENARVWNLIEPSLESRLQEIFVSSEGDIRIYQLDAIHP